MFRSLHWVKGRGSHIILEKLHKKVLGKFSMLNAKCVRTPLVNHFRLFGSWCRRMRKKLKICQKLHMLVQWDA